MEEPKDQKDENWIVVKYFVKLTTWLAAMKPDSSQTGFNSNDNTTTTEQLVEKTFEELLDGWEWVRSPKEELAIKISYENALRIERELQELQTTASSIKLRHYFFKKCSRFMASLSEEERKLLQTVLDAPKRSAIIKTAIKSLEQPWLEFIREKFFLRSVAPAYTTSVTYSESPVSSTEIEIPYPNERMTRSEEISASDISPDVSPSTSPSTSPPYWPPQTYHQQPASKTFNVPITTVSGSWEVFANSYQEQSYEKNIAGSMASVGFQASHGAVGEQGLTTRILGDIIWSVFSTLSHAVCQTLKRTSLNAEEMQSLAKRVLAMKDPLVQLWIQTIKNSRIGSQNEGRLIAKWREEEEKEKQRLLEIKRRGADARFYDEERQQRIAMAQKKRKLRGEDSLLDEEEEFGIFSSEAPPSNIRIIEDYQPHPQRDDFLKAKRLLEATLFGRGAPFSTRTKKEEPALPKVRVKIDMSDSMSFTPSSLSASSTTSTFAPSSSLVSSTSSLMSSSTLSLESSTSSMSPSTSPLASSAIPPMCSISPSIQRLTDSFYVC